MLEISQLIQGYLIYLEFFGTAHCEDPLPVGRSVNIKAILRFSGKVST